MAVSADRTTMLTPKPRILVNHLYEPSNRISGVSRYLFALLAELVKRGRFRYVLATTWTAERLPAPLRAHDLEIVTCRYIESTPLNVANQLVLVPKLFNRHNCVAEFNCNSIGCFHPGWPRVITVHDLYMQTLPSLYPAHLRLWWNLFFPAIARASDAIVCVSRTTQSDVETHHPALAGRTLVVHEAGALADDGPSEVAGGLPDGVHGLFVGNVAPNKNVELLAEAMKLCEERGRPVPIFHVGGDGGGILAATMAGSGLTNPIRSLGSLPDQMLSAAYRRAAFLVSTSKREGFCLPVIEAQERGVPVICSDIPIFREVAGHGALYFSLDNPAELADHLLAVQGDAVLRARLSAASRQNAARFSWGRAAEKIEEIIENVIGHGAAVRPSVQAEYSAEAGLLRDGGK